MKVALLTRLVSAASASLLLASACGGSSFSQHDAPGGGASAGSSGSGGSGKGGSGSGGSGTAGAASAGSGGTSSAGSGNAGSGPGEPRCTAALQPGSCSAAFQRWYHDPKTGICRPFVYGGCDGNENNYESLAECQAACPTNAPDYDTCTAPDDCTVTLANTACCGVCDTPALTTWDMVAVNKQHLIAVGGQCLRIAPPRDAPICAPCAIPPDEGGLKFFVANCVAGQCVVEDVRKSPVSACKKDEDCRVRNGNDCCEGCGVLKSIAVNTTNAFEELVCGAMPPGCPECDVAVGAAVARCGASGFCALAYPPLAP